MNSIAIYPYKEDHEIRKMRVQAWFHAVSLESGLTPRELEKKFSESETEKKVKRSCVWNKYRRGEVVPRSGPRPDGKPNLVDRVETAYPGTAKWLTLPLWRLLDRAPMEMSEIRRCYESLPRPMRAMFIHPDATESSVFWQRKLATEDSCAVLIKFGGIDGFIAMLAMIKEAEIIQDERSHRLVMQKSIDYHARLKHGFLYELFGTGIVGYLEKRRVAIKYFTNAASKRQ